MRRNRVAKTERVTSPASSWAVELRPSLLANRMNVRCRDGKLDDERRVAVRDQPEVPHDGFAAIRLHEPSEPGGEHRARVGRVRRPGGVARLGAQQQRLVDRGIEAGVVPDGRDETGRGIDAFGDEFGSGGALLVVDSVRDGDPLEHFAVPLQDLGREQTLGEDRRIGEVAARDRVLHRQSLEQVHRDCLSIRLGNAVLDHGA